MARRNGKKGQWLVSDDYTGFTKYASVTTLDYWNNRVEKPLIRNLQEIATPLLDPYPVPYYRGPQYEQVRNCIAESQPIFIGNTNIPTPNTSPATQALNLNPGLGEMSIGCTFRVF